MSICENCKREHDGSYGSGRFCDTKCARGFSTKNKRKEINKRVSKKLTKETETRFCVCGNNFEVLLKSKKKFCSRACAYANYTLKNPEEESQIRSKRAKRRHKENDENFGWQTRNRLEPSFPEKFMMEVFDHQGIEYEREKKVGKYFIDFAIGNFAFEVDGRQHANRREKDAEKDSYLQENGWQVFRLEWSNPKSKAGLKKIKTQIENFVAMV